MRVLLTGGTGFVGSNLAKLYAEWHRLDVVVSGTRRPDKDLPGEFRALDLLDKEATLRVIAEVKPDVVVHAAIINDLPRIYKERELAWDVYVEATRNIVDAANAIDATLVYVSTDWVFDGTQSGATEDTPPNPVNYYGFLKAAGEIVTLERARKPVVARIAGVNGEHWARSVGAQRQNPGLGNYVAALVETLSAGKEFSVWMGEGINERGTPSLASECGEMILLLAQAGARGVFHCCGGESVTRLELARTAVDVFELDPGLLRTGDPDPAAMMPGLVPRDTSLDANATAGLIGYALPSVRMLLQAFRAQRETGDVRPVSSL